MSGRNVGRRARQAAWLIGVLVLSACGGGDDVVGTGGPPTVGAAGGTVGGPDGARVEFPPNALAGEVTVRIAKNANGAPPLPADLVRAAGDVYAITPHGGDFAVPATVRIPVVQLPADGAEQLLLLTAEPGDTQWRVLAGAGYESGRMVAQTQHFSYFVPVLTLQRQFPTLTLRVEGHNNQGSGGAGVIAPDTELTEFPLGDRDLVSGGTYARHKMRVDARLGFPSQVATRAGVAPPALCEPAGLAHDAVQWNFQANGAAFVPLVDHRRRGPALSGEPLAGRPDVREVRREHLDGDRAIQLGVVGLEHHAHAARTDHALDVVPTQPAEQFRMARRGEAGTDDGFP